MADGTPRSFGENFTPAETGFIPSWSTTLGVPPSRTSINQFKRIFGRAIYAGTLTPTNILIIRPLTTYDQIVQPGGGITFTINLAGSSIYDHRGAVLFYLQVVTETPGSITWNSIVRGADGNPAPTWLPIGAHQVMIVYDAISGGGRGEVYFDARTEAQLVAREQTLWATSPGGSFATMPSHRSTKLTGNVTNIPIANSWCQKFQAVGTAVTLTPGGGQCRKPDGVLQTTGTLNNGRRCFVHADGTNLNVEGVVT